VNVQGGYSAGTAISQDGWGTNNTSYFQIMLNAAGETNLTVSFAAQRSATGPTQLKLQYSSDGGANFTDSTTFDVDTTFSSTGVLSANLSGVATLNNTTNVVFRLVGLNVSNGSAGSLRVDNFTIEAVNEEEQIFGANSNIVITELGTGYANTHQWFEIYNRGIHPVDIAGWKIQVGASNYSITNYQGGSVISGSTYAVVARVATNFVNSYPDFTGQLFTAAYPTLSNTGRQVTLKDSGLNTIESFTYITNLTGTLERRNYDWPEYSATNWENSAATNGTPNKQNTRKFVRVYFNFPPSHNGSSETNVDLAFINLVNSSTGTAWCAFYQLNRQGVVDSLCNAKTNRSVDVRLTTDTDYFSDANYTNFYAQLQSAGITIKGDARSSLHHDKFAVIDGRYVWSGSWNSTDSGTTDDVQNGLIIDSVSLAQAYQREFNQFWSNKFGTAKTKGGTNAHTVAGAAIKVFFAPKDGCVSNIVSVAQSATSNNYFEVYTFTTNAISNAIITNKNNGLTVQGYMDNLSAGSSSSMYKPLTNAFVDVLKDNYSGLLHHKVMIVDAGVTNNAQVVTGSFNWTKAAETENDENLLIIYSYDIGNIFYQEFLTNYGH
jgi:phosphatidylserine/phosphatidylglycerophosphate/cardiolipin synthase-like enzyme